MTVHRVPLSLTLTCLMLAATACNDDTADEAADEVDTTSGESESAESESAESESAESGTSESSESESSESESDTTDTAETTDTTSDTTGDTTEEATTDATTEESTTEGTTSDTGAETCAEVETAYQGLVDNNTACLMDSQCHVVEGHCWMGLGGCWYIVNDNVVQGDLNELANVFENLGCSGPVCACIPPPNNVGCLDGICAPL